MSHDASESSPLLPECPNCGAPLDLKRLVRGLVTCSYCGNSVALAALPTVAADPALARKIEEEALPPTLFAKLFRRNLSIAAGLLAGFSIVFAWFVFARQPDDNEIPVCVIAALASLCAIGWKRRLYAALLAFAVGGLVAVKPFVRPIMDYDYGFAFSPTSETALYFVVPGALLIGLGVVVLLRIRPARFKTDLALLEPRPLASLGLILGIGGAAALFAGRTNADAIAAFGPYLDARAQQYRAIADWIEGAGGVALPTSAVGLSPAPVYIGNDPRSNVDIVPVDAWSPRATTVSSDLYMHGFLTNALRRRAKPWWQDEWRRDEELETVELPAAAATRYAVMYRCDPHASGEPMTGCVAWMFSLETSAPLVKLVFSESKGFSEMEGYMLASLAAATGGTFLPARR